MQLKNLECLAQKRPRPKLSLAKSGVILHHIVPRLDSRVAKARARIPVGFIPTAAFALDRCATRATPARGTRPATQAP